MNAWSKQVTTRETQLSFKSEIKKRKTNGAVTTRHAIDTGQTTTVEAEDNKDRQGTVEEVEENSRDRREQHRQETTAEPQDEQDIFKCLVLAS